MPQEHVVLGTFPSASSNAIYEIRRGRDGVVYCTCPAWRMKQGKRSCKHLDEWRRTNFHRPTQGKREVLQVAQLEDGDIVEVEVRGDVFLLKVVGVEHNDIYTVIGRELLDAGEEPCSSGGLREVPFSNVMRIISKAR